jgi:hypothetical protein
MSSVVRPSELVDQLEKWKSTLEGGVARNVSSRHLAWTSADLYAQLDFSRISPKTLDFRLLTRGTLCADHSGVSQSDRRVNPDRRGRARGGRRAGDRKVSIPGSVGPPCIECGSEDVHFVRTTRDFDEYWCRSCESWVFRRRSAS